MHLSLYRAERPEVFQEIIGQKHIVKILRNQLANETVNQAYLFTGTRGTGKTTTARILAKAVNCTCGDATGVPCGKCESCLEIKAGNYLDVVELDASSYNSVDDIRAIIESVQFPPALGKYKVYIIDEVHMLTTAAENAFLKTLEEPPDYAIFILATTDPDKVRQTIRSRCMTLNFKRVSENDLVQGMRAICSKRGVQVNDDALALIARRADGSVRDGLSILEQCISAGDEVVTRDMVLDYIGSAGFDYYIEITDAVLGGRLGEAMISIDDAIRDGRDAKQLLIDWQQHFRDLMIVKYVGDAEAVLGNSQENMARIKEQAADMDATTIEHGLKLLSEYVNLGRYSTYPRLLLETVAVKLAGGVNGTDSVKLGDVSHVRRGARPARAERPEMPEGPTPVADGEQQISLPKEEIAIAEIRKPLSDCLTEEDRGATANSDLASMWYALSDDLAATDPSFAVMVEPYGMVTSFADNEITVTIKANKLSFAEGFLEALTEIARNLYGDNVYVIMRAGDVPDRTKQNEPEVAEALADDYAVEESDEQSIVDLADDIGSMLGMNVEIV